jgi:hypothetical protein
MKPEEITQVVAQTSDLVANHYVFAEVGATLRELLQQRLAEGRYHQASDPADLAAQVTADLQSHNGDLHLRLKHHPQPIPDLPESAGLIENLAQQAAQSMAGVGRVERLPGNIALLELGPLLFPPSMTGFAIVAAMQLASAADALILDLRGTLGGDPSTVALIASYLFDDPTHLQTMHLRSGETLQSWTLPYVPGPRFGQTKPVYVLIGADTFSGGEELAYDLQQYGRATVVGTRTAGGAHPRVGFRVHPHLEVTVPTARPVHPVSGGNWEKVGVIPDVTVKDNEDARTVAHRLAQQHIAEPAENLVTA